MSENEKCPKCGRETPKEDGQYCRWCGMSFAGSLRLMLAAVTKERDEALAVLKGEPFLYDLLWNIRQAIGDNGKLMLSELPDAIKAKLAKEAKP